VVVSSRVGNLKHPAYPGLDDYGEATDTSIPCYLCLDWVTPDGLGTWGDGRFFLIGLKGYIELRKYIDVAASKERDHVIVVNDDGEQHFKVNGTVGLPYFGRLIRYSLDGVRRQWGRSTPSAPSRSPSRLRRKRRGSASMQRSGG